MAATMKHRRSSSKRDSTRASDRYDKELTKYKKVVKNGGSLVVRSKATKKYVPSHTVCEDNPVYKNVKVISKKKK